MKTKMKKQVSLVLVMLVVVCKANDPELDTIERALESLSNVVERYKNEFVTKVNLQELQEVIDTIDKSMLDYQGTAKNNLDALRSLYSASRFTYQKCVDPVFEWCVAANSTLDIFIPNINNTILSPHDKDIIWNMTASVLGSGLNRAYSSLELLDQLKIEANHLKDLLKLMLENVDRDFGPNGMYARRQEELKDAILTSHVQTKNKHSVSSIITDVIGKFFRAILALLKNPQGGLKTIIEEFNREGLREVIEERRIATYQEELRAIQTLFKAVKGQIEVASNVAGRVNVDLTEDKANLEVLIPAHNNPAHKVSSFTLT
ncbi:hypothetical protein KR009_005178 [Drosophila setifemur]|nr:hypothetical protein KR009_005178 [Drosophila setifemur]